mgnify:CR=1 FL=1
MKYKALILTLAVMLVLSIAVQSFQISNLREQGGQVTGNVVKTSSGGESYEEMMARMHPSQASQAKQASTPTMVGGC